MLASPSDEAVRAQPLLETLRDERPSPASKNAAGLSATAASRKRLLDCLYLLAMGLVGLTSNVVCSLIAPILPDEYLRLGIDVSWVGSVFAVYSVAVLIFTPIISAVTSSTSVSSSSNTNSNAATDDAVPAALAVDVEKHAGLERNAEIKDAGQMNQAEKIASQLVEKSCFQRRVRVLLFGLLMQGVAASLFGLAPDFVPENPGAILAIHLVTRTCGGIGQALSNLAVFSMVADRFVHDLGFVMGLNEVVIGVGFSAGPPIGSWLELLGNSFACPFLVSGSMILSITMPVVVLLWSFELKNFLIENALIENKQEHTSSSKRSSSRSKNMTTTSRSASPASSKAKTLSEKVEGMKATTSNESTQQVLLSPTSIGAQLTPSIRSPTSKTNQDQEAYPEETEEGRSVNLFQLLSYTSIMVPSGFLFFGTFVFGLVEPIYAIHARKFLHLDIVTIGYMYCALSVSYSVFGVPAGAIADRQSQYLPVLKIGALISGIALLLFGDYYDLLGLNIGTEGVAQQVGSTMPEVEFEAAIMLLLGVGQAALLVPTLPAMKQGAGEAKKKFLQDTGRSVSIATDTVVALFNMFQQLGLIVGPLAGAYLREAIGFAHTMRLGGSAVLLYLILAQFIPA
ncbi:unnamed protein product [Amoebophrya sp. A25]|nr:unnamed protein product [Amoebophrya sp. A25]|eukprot:GSA25T00000515001.1